MRGCSAARMIGSGAGVRSPGRVSVTAELENRVGGRAIAVLKSQPAARRAAGDGQGAARRRALGPRLAAGARVTCAKISSPFRSRGFKTVRTVPC